MVQIAALSAPSSQTASLLNTVLDSFQSEVPAYASLVQRLGTMIGASAKPAAIHPLMQKATSAGPEQQGAWQAALLKGLAQGLKSQKGASSALAGEQELFIRTFFEHPSGGVRRASLDMLKVIGLQKTSLTAKAMERAGQMAGDRSQPEEKRVEAIQFIALGNTTPYADRLQGLIAPNESSSIQKAALRTLGTIAGINVSQYLLTQWADLTPEVREEALNTFLVDSGRIRVLLDAIETGRVQPASIGWPRTVRLMSQSDRKLRDRARMLLTKTESEQMNVTKAYQNVFSLKGDPIKGKAIFGQHCSGCHQVRGSMGVGFGPDLGTVHNWSPEAIMANILAPGLSISSGYDLWEVELKNEPAVQGIISAETPVTITLLNAGRVERTIKRADIAAIRALNLSAMPGGLEKQINQQQWRICWLS
jgi:putative heme-binding domain-containing protein